MLWSTRRRFLTMTASTFAAATLSAQANEVDCDVAVIGGSVGGFAAALAALRGGMRVVLTEETDWLGGQLTSQAVPPDEHPWIEFFGCTRSYREYRNAVRRYYRDHYPLNEAARLRYDLNPGNGSVSRLTHEFRVSVAVLEATLLPYLSNGQLTLLLEHAPEGASTNHDRIAAVTMRDLRRQVRRTITARYYIDATELGDLLPLAQAEFVTGAEAHSQTGELHAPSIAQPANNQSFTFCFAMDYLESEDHTIEKPLDFAFWREYVPKLNPPWTGPLFSWTACDPKTLQPREAYFEPDPSKASRAGLNLFAYRRITDPSNFVPGTYRSGITLVNWPQNDFWLGDLLTASPQQKQTLLDRAKQLSLSFLYWMQTEAPRSSGQAGWKGLRLRKDIVGTDDGLAKAPYIRESRRIEAEFTVLEQHVGTEMRMKLTGKPTEDVTAESFSDSVGIGCYRIDLHPSAGGSNYIDVSSVPFQIPLGALIPRRLDNLLAGCKNTGTTHITNGCYRLHPVEWNIGEAAGAIAAFCVKTSQSPRAVRSKRSSLESFQNELRLRGFELAWPHIRPV